MKKFAVLIAALALSACSSVPTQQAAIPDDTLPPTPQTLIGGGDEFGAGCAAVPTDASNPGSFEAMAKVPVATAASGNPLLSTLVSAVGAAELGDSLNNAKDITVFAPTNDAFAKIPQADLDAILADKEQLTKILTYHVVPQRLTPADLAGAHPTLQGGEVKVTGSGTEFTVNEAAEVVCGNVQTGNATVYLIDSVLMPM